MFLLQYHFLGNNFDEKILVENFFVKFISSETVWMKKNLLQNFLVEIFFLAENYFVSKSFPGKQFGLMKFWSKNFLVENFLIEIFIVAI